MARSHIARLSRDAKIILVYCLEADSAMCVFQVKLVAAPAPGMCSGRATCIHPFVRKLHIVLG